MSTGDHLRLARNRDSLLSMIRAIREGHRVLRRLGIPIEPRSHRRFEWISEPILLAIARKMLTSEAAAIKIGHALEARDEWQTLADEFRMLAAQARLATSALDLLYRYLDPTVAPVTDGSAEMAPRWRAWTG